jgi:acetyl esterase/lipase
MMSKLATLSRSRIFAVNYRLCPQSPFPAQIVDVFLGYLYLLYPPPGSLHAPVPASKIVFVGDSFGAVLFLALTQIILTLKSPPSNSNFGQTILFRGQNVPLPLPAGLALISPYSYTPDAFPSWETNAIYDWFPVVKYPIVRNSTFEFCEAWPTKPLRGDLYCNTSMLGHPLVCLAANKSWKGCPPIYMASGQERCIDGAKAIATQMVRDGVTVCWEEYEAMPHVFMSFLPRWKQGSMCYERWVAYVKKCLEGGELKTEGFVIGCEDLKIREVDVGTLSDYTPEYAVRMIEVKKRERREWLETFKRAKSLL